MTDDTQDPQEQAADERERAEAEALADALDARTSEHTPPQDALAAALLMRHGGPRAELPAARSEAILAQLSAELPGATRRKPARVVKLWAWGGGLAAAAALALALSSVLLPSSEPLASPMSASKAAAPPALPQPSMQLLSAQSAWVRNDDAAANAQFERELSAYRAELFRALQAAYPAQVGSLDPALRRVP